MCLPPLKQIHSILKLAGNKRRSFSGTGGLLNRVFGSSGSKTDKSDDSPDSQQDNPSPPPKTTTEHAAGHQDVPFVETPIADKRDTSSESKSPSSATSDKKRRTSSVSKAKDIFSSARSSLSFGGGTTFDSPFQSDMQKLSKGDPALGVPQGSMNNSAGESSPGPHSTFRVGVTEDKNKKCRRTMEDTHAYLYNFLSTPRVDADSQESKTVNANQVIETDNGYFAIFDGHAGSFAADWCGKKLHLILEDIIKRNPNTPIPEILDQTFTTADKELEKLPLKNSGCTAVVAVLRWEDRVPNTSSATGSANINAAAAKDASADDEQKSHKPVAGSDAEAVATSEAKLRTAASRQRVLYTANVGDARIVLCRNGRALRLSYDHKGSDETEGRRVAGAGGLILNNRVNGVLAVTRALGDTYMKDLVTGHPYTTETVIQPEQDEFLILACDGLWDVCSDQEAVDLIRSEKSSKAASKTLVEHALGKFSTDNLSCMVVRFDTHAVKTLKEESSIGVEGDVNTGTGGMTEAEAIVADATKNPTTTGTSNSNPDTIAEESLDKQEPEIKLNPEAVEAAKKNP